MDALRFRGLNKTDKHCSGVHDKDNRLTGKPVWGLRAYTEKEGSYCNLNRIKTMIIIIMIIINNIDSICLTS